MNRIANALEKVEAIKNTSDANTQQYQKLKQELATDIKKALAERPTAQYNLDPQAFAKYVLPPLVQGLPDVKQVQAAGAEIINQIKAERERIPAKITIQGDFYGFTNWKPFLAYTIILILAGAFSAYSWYQNQESVIYKQALEVAKERDFYRNQIDNYKAQNPTYANLFPDYDDGGFWQKTENQTKPQNQP